MHNIIMEYKGFLCWEKNGKWYVEAHSGEYKNYDECKLCIDSSEWI